MLADALAVEVSGHAGQFDLAMPLDYCKAAWPKR
jgi:hypothetical protein